MNHVQNLVKMANEIEKFFRAEPDREIAVSGIETHLRRFWDPRMRKAIIAHVEAGGSGLGDMAVAAVRKLAHKDAAVN